MKIKLIKHLHSCFAGVSTGDRWVFMDIEIPACPSVEWFILGERVKEIEFDGDNINCYCEPDETFYDVKKSMFRATREQMDELVLEYVSKGWSEKVKEHGK